jgi:hypothetical protein
MEAGSKPKSVGSMRASAARLPLVVSSLVVVFAVAWFAAARGSMLMAAVDRSQTALASAERILAAHRQRTQMVLKNQAQILSEDPRLKSTLSTPDIDEPTIVDILKDLSKLSGKELLAVLTPNARVKAVLGAEQFRGLDLSTSGLLKGAQAADAAVSGSWVVGDKLYDVAAAALRVGDRTIAFLVLGEAVDKRVLDHLYETTGTGAALLVDNRVALSVPDVPEYRTAFDKVAPESSTDSAPRRLEVDGEQYIARTLGVEGATIPTRVALVRPLRTALQHERLLGLLVWGPLLGAVGLTCFSVWRFLNR